MKILGSSRDPKLDILKYTFQLNEVERVIKSTMFSIIAKIFYHMGLVALVTVNAKIIIQKLWQKKIEWNESVSIEL